MKQVASSSSSSLSSLFRRGFLAQSRKAPLKRRRRFPFRGSLLLFLLSWFAAVSGGQSANPSSAPTVSNLQNVTATAEAMPENEAKDMDQFVAYWTAEGGWQSELQLRNNLPNEDLSVTPVVRTADGTETTLPVVTIKPAAVRSIDIGASAPQLAGKYGSVRLRYHSAASRGLYTSIMIRDTGHPIAFHLDGVEEAVNFEQVSREGVWWLPNEGAADYLVLTNQGKNVIKFQLSIYDSGGKEFKQNFTLGPQQTSRYSVREIVRAKGISGSYGGIKIQAGVHAGSLDSVHFLFDEQAGFSALLKMFDYDSRAVIKDRDFAKTGVWTLRAPMLALSQPDPALQFPPDTVLRPQIFIRNTTAKPSVANLRFIWRKQSTTGSATGPEVKLSPFETRRIDVGKLQDGKTLPQDANWTSIVLTTKGQPDEIMAVAASYDDSLRYGGQTPFSDQLTFKWEGSRWEYDARHNSIITGGNGGTKPTRVAFTIFYNEGTGRYEMERTLQPEEQMWIDVGRLIRERIPDKNGKMLPVDLTSGSYEFRDLTNPTNGTLFEGKVVYDKTFGHVAYGCGGPCCDTTPFFQFNPLGVPLNFTSGQGVEVPDNCGGLILDNSAFWGNWSTGSIASVDYYGTHTGYSAGSTTSFTSGVLQEPYGRYRCSAQTRSPSGPTNVQIPGSLQILSTSVLPTGTTGDYGCQPGSDYGIELDVQYQVLDQNTPARPLKNATMVPHEHVVVPATGQTTDGDICPSRISTCSHTTDANGIFHDAPYGGCGTGPFSVNFTQTITIIFNGASYTVRTNNVTVSSSSSGHGSISNGSDISKSR